MIFDAFAASFCWSQGRHSRFPFARLAFGEDKPDRIRMSLTRTSETIPFADGQLLLGTWQGIFLWEHRRAPHTRNVVLTFVG